MLKMLVMNPSCGMKVADEYSHQYLAAENTSKCRD